MRIVAWVIIGSSILPGSIGRPNITSDARWPNLLPVRNSYPPVTHAACGSVAFPLEGWRPPVLPPDADPSLDVTGHQLVLELPRARVYLRRAGSTAEVLVLSQAAPGYWISRRESCTLREAGSQHQRTASWTFLEARGSWVTIRVFDSGQWCKDNPMEHSVKFAAVSMRTETVYLRVWSEHPSNICLAMDNERPAVFHLELPEPLRGRVVVDGGAIPT